MRPDTQSNHCIFYFISPLILDFLKPVTTLDSRYHQHHTSLIMPPKQVSLGFPSSSKGLQASNIISPLPSSASINTSPSKRNRSSTTNAKDVLPQSQRPRKSAPSLKATGSFMFTGPNPLYRREVIDEPNSHHLMKIYCTQPGCTYEPKIISRSLSGTNNHKSHYRKFHPNIPLSEAEVNAIKDPKTNAEQKKSFFDKPPTEESTNENYRRYLVEWVIKNNLSFSIVDQPETKRLFKLIAPNITQVSRRTLTRDLQSRFDAAFTQIKAKVREQIESGGRIALTTDAWAGNNKLDYIAVTAHWKDINGKMESILLDIIELKNPSHTGTYLCKVLVEVTDRFDITQSILSVTRDNASPNNTMLEEFEKLVHERYETLTPRDQAYFSLKFTRREGDVRCVAHIYNIAVQAGMFSHRIICSISNKQKLSKASDPIPTKICTITVTIQATLPPPTTTKRSQLFLSREVFRFFSKYESNLVSSFNKCAKPTTSNTKISFATCQFDGIRPIGCWTIF